MIIELLRISSNVIFSLLFVLSMSQQNKYLHTGTFPLINDIFNTQLTGIKYETSQVILSEKSFYFLGIIIAMLANERPLSYEITTFFPP